jgi:hypothetical protein
MTDHAETTPPTSADQTGYPSDRRERALQLVSEGRIGGARPGAGRPRKPRPSELAAESARQHWQTIEAALLAGISEGTPEQRARAAQQWLRIGLGEGQLEQRERAEDRLDAYSLMSEDEVRQRFARQVAEMLVGGHMDPSEILAALPAPVEAVEVDDGAEVGRSASFDGL